MMSEYGWTEDHRGWLEEHVDASKLETECGDCDGDGYISVSRGRSYDDVAMVDEDCGTCDGTGKGEPMDMLEYAAWELPPPDEYDEWLEEQDGEEMIEYPGTSYDPESGGEIPVLFEYGPPDSGVGYDGDYTLIEVDGNADPDSWPAFARDERWQETAWLDIVEEMNRGNEEVES